MPLLWKTLLSTKIKFFLFTLFCCLSLLIITRITEIARIALMCQSLQGSFLFTLLHLPIFLPLSIPIASLISSYLLQKQLIETRTFFALLTSGFSLSKILTPILMLNLITSILNFFFVSETATIAWHKTKNLPHQFAKKDPIQMVLYKIQEDSKGVVIPQAFNKDKTAIFFAPEHQKRLVSLLTSDMLFAHGKIEFKDLDTITYVQQEDFDHIYLENRRGGSMEITQNLKGFLPAIKSNQVDYFPLSILIKAKELAPKKVIIAEITRRFFWALAPLTCSLVGLCLAMCCLKKRIILSLLVFSIFASLFFAASFITFASLSITLMALCQLFTLVFACFNINKIKRGITL